MSKLNVDQQSIGKLFSDRKTNFLIPDYQRPYAWGEEECLTLWNDIREFAFPGDNSTDFDPDNEYFLGPIVTFNNNKKMEVIDGQQRLTTFMLILRAFYDHFLNMRDEDSKNLCRDLAKCIWKIDELERPIFDCLKIDSEVATDEDKDEFITILKTGEVPEGSRSTYAKNYKFFCEKIQEFKDNYVSYFVMFPRRILNNCILLPIEADSQDTALRIFSTLNDRGKPLSDSDIFKAQMYKYFSNKNEKNEFIEKWKKLENICNIAFDGIKDNTLDEVFTRYMYFQRAKQENKLTTTEALRKFYEKADYTVLKNDFAINDLIDLACFWRDVKIQNQNRFSDHILKQLSILDNGPNSMWTYMVSVYYLTNRNNDGYLDEERFERFLDKCIAFTFAYAIDNPGLNSLRSPMYAEMINIVNGKDVTFSEYKFDREILKTKINAFTFSNIKPVTRSFITWWAYQDTEQQLLQADTKFDVEHIYAKQKNQINGLSNQRNLESLGNKSLLERKINIRASDYKFVDKKCYYLGFSTSNGQKKEGTVIAELKHMAKCMDDFDEKDIMEREDRIVNAFMKYLESQELLKE